MRNAERKKLLLRRERLVVRRDAVIASNEVMKKDGKISKVLALKEVSQSAQAAASLTVLLKAPFYIHEQSPNHRHRNLKAFAEHIQRHVFVRFVTDQYL